MQDLTLGDLCGLCGAPLQELPPSREERKVVTVLFCDLVGSTAQAERMDPEDVRALNFWRSVGAMRYIRQAEALLSAPVARRSSVGPGA